MSMLSWDPLRGDPRFEKIVASLAPKNSKAQRGCSTQRNHARHRMKYWEIIADKLSKAGWSLGWVQPWIPKGERSGSQTRIATTVNVMWCTRTKTVSIS